MLWTLNSRTVRLIIVSILLPNTFPISSKTYCGICSAGLIVSIIEVNVYQRSTFFVLFPPSSMSYNTINIIYLIIGIAVGAILVSVCLEFHHWDYKMVECGWYWVSWHGRSVYYAIDGKYIFDATFVDGSSIEWDAHDAGRTCTARQEIVICAGGSLVSILIFGQDS